MKRRVTWIIALAIVVLIIFYVMTIPVIGLMACENRQIVSADESHTVLYVSFDDDFNVSDKGRFAGILKGAYQNYFAYYVDGDNLHEYLYVDDYFYKKATP